MSVSFVRRTGNVLSFLFGGERLDLSAKSTFGRISVPASLPTGRAPGPGWPTMPDSTGEITAGHWRSLREAGAHLMRRDSGLEAPAIASFDRLVPLGDRKRGGEGRGDVDGRCRFKAASAGGLGSWAWEWSMLFFFFQARHEFSKDEFAEILTTPRPRHLGLS